MAGHLTDANDIDVSVAPSAARSVQLFNDNFHLEYLLSLYLLWLMHLRIALL